MRGPTTRRDFLGCCAAAAVVGSGGSRRAQALKPRVWPSTFPALRQHINGQPLTFLDSAATTLRPQSVIDALVDYYSTDSANPSRAYTLASRSADRLTGARQALAQFVNAGDPSEIIFVRGATEGINLVAATWGAANLKSATRSCSRSPSTRRISCRGRGRPGKPARTSVS
jgi:histidinol-phosphate/aromatic aminotransferase/cobyric acid decarboxylase-like protein